MSQGAMEQMPVQLHDLSLVDEAGTRALAAPRTRKPEQLAQAESALKVFS